MIDLPFLNNTLFGSIEFTFFSVQAIKGERSGFSTNCSCFINTERLTPVATERARVICNILKMGLFYAGPRPWK